jgi:RES domain-containing protein
MALDFPYICYGRIIKNGSSVASNTVYVMDLTTPNGVATAITDSNGAYVCDIMDVASNGDRIKVWSSKTESGVSYMDSYIFTLDISGAAQEINLILDNGYQSIKIIDNDKTRTINKW